MEERKKKLRKDSIDYDTRIELECDVCHKIFLKERWKYNQTLRRYPNQIRWFCSLECNYKSRFGHKTPQETRDKIRQSQKGISVLSRGRTGHKVSEEVKEKIRLKKLGIPHKEDHDVVVRELSFRNTQKYAITKGLVPDAIFIEDGRLVALELEKKRHETEIRRKMKQYDNRNDYDKVIIVWYSPDGKRLKEWQKDKGEWKIIS
jgi:hypothetical protein